MIRREGLDLCLHYDGSEPFCTVLWTGHLCSRVVINGNCRSLTTVVISRVLKDKLPSPKRKATERYPANN